MTELENFSYETLTRRSEDTSRTMKNNIEIPLINSVLPPEMLQKIFSHLAPKDLKTVMLICKTWNEAADTPALWSWVETRFQSQFQLKITITRGTGQVYRLRSIFVSFLHN